MKSSDKRQDSTTNTEKDEPVSENGLASRIARLSSGLNRVDTIIDGLTLHRWPMPTEPTSYMLAPSLCLIGQGRKRLYLGEETYVYDANRFLITSVDLPVISHIIEASDEKPYLGLTLELDLKVIARMMLEQDEPRVKVDGERGAIAVGEVSEHLLNAIERLMDLLDSPDDIPMLAPLIKQEIFYRLLNSDQGPRLRRLVSSESHTYRIARSIDWLKDNFDKPLRIEQLANRAGLSTSAFHNHFRVMTAMSPLQFQKKIRLNEARRLMLTERMDASTAAFEVGYESATQFNREYSRHFGTPPMRDIKNMMDATARS